MSGEPREEIGPYLVYEQLGSGGMATVHRAEQRGIAGFRRVVALKRLHANVAADPDLLKAFFHEARLASHLKHTNVAQTFELGKVGETYFIAMEFVAGPTLGQLMRQCAQAAGPIPLGIVLSILIQICDALDHAHNLCDEFGRPLGIIHRDVSPSNVIVSNTGTVKLIDFGIAKAENSDVRTQTGMIKGKFGYIAPEYLLGELHPRGDLFGAGVIAHELIAGRSLFLGRNDFDTLNRLREMQVQPPSRWNPEVTPDLDDIVLTALQRDPAQRWQSAAAMRNALQNAMRPFGAITNQQVADWVEWAFMQLPRPETSDVRNELDGFDDPSVLIDGGQRASASSSMPPLDPSDSSFATTTPDPLAPPPAPMPSAFAPGATPPGFQPAVRPSAPPTSPGFLAAARASSDSGDQRLTLAEIPPEVLPPSAFSPRLSSPRLSSPLISTLRNAAVTPSEPSDLRPTLSSLPPEVLPPSAFAPEPLPPETLPPSAFAPETLPPSEFAAETPPAPPPLPTHLLPGAPPGPPVDPAVKLAAAMLAPAMPAPVTAPKLVPARSKGLTTPPVVVGRDKPPSAPPPLPPALPPASRDKPPTEPPPMPAVRAKAPTAPPPLPAAAAKPPPVPPSAPAGPPPLPTGVRSKPASLPPPIPATPSPAKPPPVPPSARTGASGTRPPPPPPPPRTPDGDSLGATEPHLARFDSVDTTDPAPRMSDLDPTDPIPRELEEAPPARRSSRPRGRSLEELAGLPSPPWATGAGAAGARAEGDAPARPSAPPPPPSPGKAALEARSAAEPLAAESAADAPPAPPPSKAASKQDAPAAARPPSEEEAPREGARWWLVLLLLLLAAAAAAAAVYYFGLPFDL